MLLRQKKESYTTPATETQGSTPSSARRMWIRGKSRQSWDSGTIRSCDRTVKGWVHNWVVDVLGLGGIRFHSMV